MALRIEDYAIIGNCETAALVGRDGSIDWLCIPRFDSAACFAALLGTAEHGRWQVAPAVPVRAVRRRYRPGTLVLETEFETDDGRRRADRLHADRATPRPGPDGRGQARRRPHAGRAGPPAGLRVADSVGAPARPTGSARSAAPTPSGCGRRSRRPGRGLPDGGRLHRGARASASRSRSPGIRPTSPSRRRAPPSGAIEETETWWRDWSERCTYEGDWRGARWSDRSSR